MTKTICCPNCLFKQQKYTTTTESSVSTCIKCGFKWGADKPAESVTNKSINHFKEGSSTKINVAKASSSMLIQNLKRKQQQRQGLEQYNQTVVVEKVDLSKFNKPDPKAPKVKPLEKAPLPDPKENKDYSSNQSYSSDKSFSTDKAYSAEKKFENKSFTVPNNPVQEEATTSNNAANDTEKYRKERSTANINRIDEDKYKNTASYKSPNSDNTAAYKSAEKTNSYTNAANITNPYSPSDSKEVQTPLEQMIDTEIHAYNNAYTAPKINKSEEKVASYKKPEFKTESKKLDKYKRLIEKSKSNEDDEIEDQVSLDKIFNLSKKSQESESIFDKVAPNKAKEKPSERFSEKSAYKFDTNVKSNREIRLSKLEKEDHNNYRKVTKELSRKQIKTFSLDEDTIPRMNPVQSSLKDRYNLSEDKIIKRKKKKKRPSIFDKNKVFFRKTQKRQVTEYDSYKSLFRAIKEKYLTFDDAYQSVKFAMFIGLIIAIVVISRYVFVLDTSNKKSQEQVVDNNIYSIPTIDDQEIDRYLASINDDSDTPLLLGNHKLNKNAVREETAESISVEREQQKQAVISSESPLEEIKDNFVLEENSTASIPEIEEEKGVISSYFNKISLAFKQTKDNALNDVKISNVQSVWKLDRNAKIFEASLILTNKDNASSYLINNLEVMFLDTNGNLIEKRVIETDKILRSLESSKVRLKIQNAPLGTTKTYIFLGHHSQLY